MKEILKSKKVIIYLVVVLMLSTGISYAYFTATSTVNGKGSSLTSKTADPATATVEAEGIVNFNDNDMYPGHKELVKVKVTGTGTKYTGQYCISTSATCTPENSLTIINKDIQSVSFSNNEKEQVLCMKLKDEYEQEVNLCSDKYKVDNEKPTVRIESTSSTTNSITINVSASDTYSKVKEYYYSIDSITSYEKSESSNKTFNTTYGSHTIRVYVLDTAGNKSTEATTTVEVKRPGKTFKQIIADNYTTIKTRANGTFNTTVTASTEKTIYKSTSDANQKDNDGKDVYYFAGNPTDNWVKFGQIKSGSTPIWWRIIRVNGDGSVRMIYAGTGTSAPATIGDGTQLSSTSAFNESYNKNAYVGYMYGTPGASSYAEEHKNSTPSTIKGVIDSWYNTTTNLSGLSTKLSHTAGFCGDRSSSTSTTGSAAQSGGYGTTVTYYGGYVRLVNKNNPTFKCTYASNDLYTTPDDSGIGNKKLSVPIGLITADEVVFAGGVYNTNNKDFYLYTGSTYWTMSPYFFYSNGLAGVFGVDNGGWLNYYYVTNAYGVRPVINLKAETLFTTEKENKPGTSENPYIPT